MGLRANPCQRAARAVVGPPWGRGRAGAVAARYGPLGAMARAGLGLGASGAATGR